MSTSQIIIARCAYIVFIYLFINGETPLTKINTILWAVKQCMVQTTNENNIIQNAF